MIKNLLGSELAIIGGGNFCKAFLQFIGSDDFGDRRPKVVGVADNNEEAPGMQYARQLELATFSDYTELYQLEGVDVLLELTNDPAICDVIRRDKPAHVKLIDHFEARMVWDTLKIDRVKINALKELQQKQHEPEAIVALLERLTHRFASIIEARNRRSREIELELFEHERTSHQIVQGSTIPTFVINKGHIVTHWNKAAETLTGYTAEQMVGTNRQWMPFYHSARLVMADVILDQIDEQEIRKLYGNKWRRSALIEGAYEAEDFFAKMGDSGKWCFFTAAPIKAPDGKIVGAIETLWDKTEEKKAEQERDRHNRELSTLCSIYTALNTPADMGERIESTIREVLDFLEADGVCIFLMESDGQFHLQYSCGPSEEACQLNQVMGPNSIIQRVAQSGKFTIYEDLPKDCDDEICQLELEELKSLAYIPISTKEQRQLGVIRIGSRQPGHFSYQNQDILELIGNRIGVAIENAMLQEQYIKSEEKYRSLFNNDPNPTFILDRQSLEILDTNQRAQDCYGYTREELYGLPFMMLGDDDDEDAASGLRNLSHHQSLLFSKKRHYKKGRMPFYVNINVSCAQYGERDVLIASTTDITESIEKETQLIQAGKMTTLGVMAAGMAHEINQPLNVIQICADFFLKMLRKGQSIGDEDLKAMANDIVANVERATNVIKHVRDFARQSEVVKSKVNINEPITDVFKVLGHQLKVHQIELELDLAPDLPPIMAEHNRLEQVFINLVTNAIDAMDEKALQPDAKNTEKRLTIRSYAANGWVAVNVIDTGTGMTEEVKSKLFEPFFTTKKTGKGTGLGISISYGIIKDYEGTIAIESQVGSGTTFIIKFPALTNGSDATS